MDGPWTIYKPDGPHGENVMFLHCGGVDWYVYRESIAAKYLLLVDNLGRILRAESLDKAQIFPIDLYTATSETLPEDFKPGTYHWDAGFTKREILPDEIMGRNRKIQMRKLKVISEEISLLTTLNLAGALSDEDSLRLNNLKRFVKDLMGVDLLNPQWPNVGNVPDEPDTGR